MTRTLKQMAQAHRENKGGNGPGPDKPGCRCDIPDPSACPFQGGAGEGLRPLPEFPAGSLVTIDGINGGHRLRCRLLAMGLTPGTTVRVGTTSCGGCCVRVRDADVFLGQGMSEKVMARPRTDTDADPAADKA